MLLTGATAAPAVAQTGRFPDVNGADAAAEPPPQADPRAPAAPPAAAPQRPPPAVVPAPQPPPLATAPDSDALPRPASPPAYGYQQPYPTAPAAGVGFYPPTLPYRSGQPIPEGYEVQSSSNSGLIVTGLLTWIAGYGAALVVGTANDFEQGTGWFALPIVGPWAVLGARENPCAGIDFDDPQIEDARCVEEAVDEAKLLAFAAVDGLVQAVGAVLLIAGVVSGRQELVRRDLAAARLVPRASASPQGFSIGAWGRF